MASYSKSSAWLTYDDLKYQLAASVLVAPIDGIVTFLTDSVAGDYVQAKQILITIADPTDLIVIIPSESSKINSFPLGDEVKVVIKGNTYKGLVIGSAMGLSADVAPVDRVTKITIDEII